MTSGQFRRQARKGGRADNSDQRIIYSWCTVCEKRAYTSRKDARKARLPKNHPYPCPANPDHWHNGHMRPEVTSGEIDRRDFYGPRGRGRIRYAPPRRENPAA